MNISTTTSSRLLGQTLLIFLIAGLWGSAILSDLFPVNRAEMDFLRLLFLIDAMVVLIVALFLQINALQSSSQNVSLSSFPLRTSLLTYGVVIPLVYLFSVSAIVIPFNLRSLSGLEGFYRTVIWLILIVIPAATAQFYFAEHHIRSVLRWSPDQWKTLSESGWMVGVRGKTWWGVLGTAVFILLAHGYLPSAAAYWIVVSTAALGIAWLTARSLGLSVRFLEEQMSEAPKELPPVTDDFVKLASDLDRSLGRWRTLHGMMGERMGSLLGQADDIVRTAKTHSSYSSQHASSLAQITASIDQLMKSAQQIADQARQVNQFTEKGTNEAETGKTHLSHTLTSMDQIHREAQISSQRILDLSIKMTQIEDVIKIINYVTDQTKILAFNASIETAGAGEAGERFGVVAKEIRQLAQNIADSTEEIKRILLDVRKASQVSVIASEKELKQVREGIGFAAQAQGTVELLSGTVRQSAESVQQIAQAIAQQQHALEQLGVSIRDIDTGAKEFLQQNVKILKSAEQLKTESEALKKLESN